MKITVGVTTFFIIFLLTPTNQYQWRESLNGKSIRQNGRHSDFSQSLITNEIHKEPNTLTCFTSLVVQVMGQKKIPKSSVKSQVKHGFTMEFRVALKHRKETFKSLNFSRTEINLHNF